MMCVHHGFVVVVVAVDFDCFFCVVVGVSEGDNVLVVFTIFVSLFGHISSLNTILLCPPDSMSFILRALVPLSIGHILGRSHTLPLCDMVDSRPVSDMKQESRPFVCVCDLSQPIYRRRLYIFCCTFSYCTYTVYE